MSWYRSRWPWLGLGGVLVIWIAMVVWTPWPSHALALPLTMDQEPQVADVMIVLGAGTRTHPPRLPPQAMDRLRKANQLWEQDTAPIVIVAGGYSRRTADPESKYMKPFLASLGVPEEKIIEENQSLDTYQNAINSVRLMEANGWETALVVTSSYHTRRGCKIFEKLDVPVTCVAAPLDDRGKIYERVLNFRSVLREYVATVYYWFKKYI